MVSKRFEKYAWFVLGVNLLVILWGAYVRATGSGAGCGSHWPSCNGEVIPRSPSSETMIEFTHRLTSGLALILVAILLFWALRTFSKGSLVRKGAVFSAIFIILEALLGAGLVLFELVADNDSVARAISMAVHLANTFLLIGSITLTAWWAGRNVKLEFKSNKKLIWLFGFGFLGILLIGMSGAVTALGDTLFPPISLSEGLQRDFSSTAHFAERLRIYHPLLAIGIGIYLLIVSLVAVMQRQDQHVRNFAAGLVVIFFIQLVAGAINVVLLAPIWLQLVHLLLADLLWIIFTLLVASSLAKYAQSEEVLNMQELSSSNPALSISETA